MLCNMPRTKKPKAEYRKTEVVVRGSGTFPTDCLRYDNCCPSSSEDSSKIDNHDGAFVQREVKLDRFSFDGSKAEADRWRSFGWAVISDSGV